MIVKVPGINGLGKTKGCRSGGKKIIEKLEEIHGKENGEEIERPGVEEIEIDEGNVEEQEKSIHDWVKGERKREKNIFLGGDHSISYPICKAFWENYNEGCLIVFDAHPDLMETIKEPTHEEWLRALIEDGFPAENVLLVGARNSWKDEVKFMNENKIKRIKMDDIENNLEEVGDLITEFSKGRPLYISIDIDVLDPAFAPSTGYIEPGGLTSRQLLYLVKRLSKVKNLKGIDIVEVDEKKDKSTGFKTVKLAAKILAEFL